jgi:hypothetical protein
MDFMVTVDKDTFLDWLETNNISGTHVMEQLPEDEDVDVVIERSRHGELTFTLSWRTNIQPVVESRRELGTW